jgi:hypothetical protein
MDILKWYFIGNYYTHSYVPCFQNFTVLINGDLKNKQDLDFPCYMSLSLFVVWDLKWEVIVRFVDIGGMETHRCLYFLFIIIFMSWFILEEYSSFALYQFNQILFSVILVIVRELHTPSASPNEQSL